MKQEIVKAFDWRKKKTVFLKVIQNHENILCEFQNISIIIFFFNA